MDPVRVRFDLEHYMPRLRAETSEGASFQKLCSFYESNIQTLLSERSWQPVLYNKTITQLFLDKISKLYPKGHPMSEVAKKFEWNSSTFASMEVTHFLEGILTSDHLSKDSKIAIRNWLKAEKEYLPIAVLMDGWRILNPKVLQGVKSGDMSHLKTTDLEGKIPIEEIEIAAQYFLKLIKNLQPGQSMKLLGGSFLHEVRIVLVKENEGFKIFSYDPAIKGHIIISNIPEENISNLSFIKNLLLGKLKGNTMEVLEASGGKIQKITDHHSKNQQLRNACPIQTIMKEFKDYFLTISDFSQYMMVKSLMAEYALKTEKEHVAPELFRALETKQAIRGRVFEWIETLKNEKTLKKTIDYYRKAFAIVDPDFVIPDSMNLETLIFLDRQLNQKVLKRTLLKEERHQLHELAKSLDAPLPIGILLQKNMRSKVIKEALEESLPISVSEILNPDDFVEILRVHGKNSPRLKEILDYALTHYFNKTSSISILQKLHSDEIISDELHKDLLRYVNSSKFEFAEESGFIKNLCNATDDEVFFSLLRRGLTYKAFRQSELVDLIIERTQSKYVNADIFIPSLVELLQQKTINAKIFQHAILNLLDQKKIPLKDVKKILRENVEKENCLPDCNLIFDVNIEQTIKSILATKEYSAKYRLLEKILKFAPSKINLFFLEFASNDPPTNLFGRLLDLLHEVKARDELITSILETFTLAGGHEVFIDFLIKNYSKENILKCPAYLNTVKNLYRSHLISPETVRLIQRKYLSKKYDELFSAYEKMLQ